MPNPLELHMFWNPSRVLFRSTKGQKKFSYEIFGLKKIKMGISLIIKHVFLAAFLWSEHKSELNGKKKGTCGKRIPSDSIVFLIRSIFRQCFVYLFLKITARIAGRFLRCFPKFEFQRIWFLINLIRIISGNASSAAFVLKFVYA